MTLVYLYLRTLGEGECPEVNLDSRHEFHFDGNSLHVSKGDALAPGFFSVIGNAHGPVESVSAVVGENGAGKTSIARFLGAFLDYEFSVRNDSILLGEYIAIFCICGKYYAFYNFYSRMEVLFEEIREFIPEKNRFNYPAGQGAEMKRARKILDSIKMVYVSPHFTAQQIFLGERVFNYSTAGLMVRVGNRSNGLANIARYAFRECLRMLQVVKAYLEIKDAPSEPVHLLRRTDVIISWRRNVLDLRQRYAIAREKWSRSEDLYKGLFNLTLRRGDRSCAALRTFAYFSLALLRERWLSEEKDAWDRDVGFAHFIKLCQNVVSDDMDDERAKHLIRKWIENEAGRRKRTSEQSCLGQERILGLEKLLKGMDRLEYLGYGGPSSGPMRIPLQHSVTATETMPVLMSVAEGYLECLGTVEFLDFDFSPMLSSGEASFLSMWGRLYDCIKKFEKLPSQKMRNRNAGYEILLFMDEAETTLHPEWQRKLVWYTIWFFEHFAPNARAHIVFASHSPMLLSDIPKSNVAFLLHGRNDYPVEKMRGDLAKIKNTFGANIYELYQLTYFLNKGPVGEFAYHKIKRLLSSVAAIGAKTSKRRVKLDDRLMDVEEMRQVIKIVGDPVLRNYFQRLQKLELV